MKFTVQPLTPWIKTGIKNYAIYCDNKIMKGTMTTNKAKLTILAIKLNQAIKNLEDKETKN